MAAQTVSCISLASRKFFSLSDENLHPLPSGSRLLACITPAQESNGIFACAALRHTAYWSAQTPADPWTYINASTPESCG